MVFSAILKDFEFDVQCSSSSRISDIPLYMKQTKYSTFTIKLHPFHKQIVQAPFGETKPCNMFFLHTSDHIDNGHSTNFFPT